MRSPNRESGYSDNHADGDKGIQKKQDFDKKAELREAKRQNEALTREGYTFEAGM